MPLIPEISNSDSREGKREEMGESRDRGPLQVKKFSSWQELETLSLEWELILRDTPGLTIFSTPEWLGAWWKGFGASNHFIGLSFSTPEGEVVGVAPFFLERLKNRPGGVRLLRLVGDGSGDSDNLDLAFRSGYEDSCSEALLKWLGSEPGWDVCELNTLNSDSDIGRAMLASLKARQWHTTVLQRPSSAVPLPTDWESYRAQLSREQAGNIDRYTRRLGRHFAVRIFKCATEDELFPSLEVLFDLHQKRWHTQGKPGSFSVEERRRFYYEMSRGFLRRGWLEFWVLELNGKPAAAQFAFRYGDTVYQLQEGLDPEHYSDRAGMVLRAHILKQLIAEGVRKYDFLGGADPHKLSWGAQAGTYTDICFARPFSRGSVHLHLREKTLKTEEWFRSHLPKPVLDGLRKFKKRVTERS